MTIDTLPDAPSAVDSAAVFDTKAFNFLAALQTFRTQANGTALDVQNNADITAALALAMALPNYGDTSTTSLAIGTGSKTFTVSAGKSWVPGQIVVASSGGSFMKGTVTSYGGTSLVVNVTTVQGSGAFPSWSIGLSYSGLGFAASGANTDITSLGALATVPAVISNSWAPPVRQTVLSGPVDSNGFSAFGGTTGSTTVTAAGTLVATAANGTANRIGSIINPSWTGLSTNGSMFLYLDIAADGSCTAGSTTLAKVEQWGGTYSTTNNQFTFNIQEMTGKVGNGSAATQTYRVFVGEVTVAGAVVTAITWYALNGRYRSATTATLPAAGTTTSFNHNLGISPDAVLGFPAAFARCTTTDSGWAVGEVMPLQAGVGAPLSPYRPEANTGRNTAIMVAGVTNAWGLLVRSTGNNAAATLASWSYYMTLNRGW